MNFKSYVVNRLHQLLALLEQSLEQSTVACKLQLHASALAFYTAAVALQTDLLQFSATPRFVVYIHCHDTVLRLKY